MAAVADQVESALLPLPADGVEALEYAALIQLGGWRIAQMPVAHHERIRGTSKYGNLSRGLDGLRDLPRMRAYVADLQRGLPEGATT